MTRLQEKMLIAVKTTHGDRRCQTVRLTAKGSALVPLLARLADQNDKEFFGHMTKAQRVAMELALRALVARHELRGVPID